MAETTKTKRLSNKVYNALKWIALIVLPALATLYSFLASTWDLPNADKVVGTIVAIDTFLGVVLKISSNQYYKHGKNFDGDLNVIPDEDGGERVQFAFDRDPRDILADEPGKHTFEYRVQKLKGDTDEH